jgi:hypothetical protein
MRTRAYPPILHALAADAYSPTQHAERQVGALNGCEEGPRSVTGLAPVPEAAHGPGSLVLSRCGAFPPVDGFCVGGHAVEEIGDELGVGASAVGEAEHPEFCGCLVVVVDRLIRGIGVDLAGAVAVDRCPDVAEQLIYSPARSVQLSTEVLKTTSVSGMTVPVTT